MEKWFDGLRRNPDAVAIAALCLLLGVGGKVVSAHGAAFGEQARFGIHQAWQRTTEGASCAMRSQFNECFEDVPELFSLPEIER